MARPRGTRAHLPEEHVDDIIEWVSNGKLLADYCDLPGKPSWSTVYEWKAEDEEFAARLAAARECGYDRIGEEVIRIADGDDFRPFTDTKTRIDARIRMLGRWSHRFSEKRHVEQSGNSTIQVVTGVPAPTPTRSSLLE